MFVRAVRFRLTRLHFYLRSPIGRMLFRVRMLNKLWPAFRVVGWTYRRTLGRGKRVIAVTGTFGKSTTVRALECVINGISSTKVHPNFLSGMAMRLFSMTPGTKRRAIEAGLHGFGVAEQYASMLRPDVAVITSVGSEHSSSFQTLETTREEKAKLLKGLRPGGAAVLNGDDPNVRWMGGLTRERVIFYGLGPENDVWADEVALDWPRGTRFRLRAEGEIREASVRLIGRNMVRCALAAIAAARAEGMALELILKRLENLPPTPGRLQPIALPGGAWVLNDSFKGGEETIDEALDILAEIPARRKIVVIGAASEVIGKPRPVYRRLGERIGRIADRLVIWNGDDQAYASGAARGGMPREEIFKTKRILRPTVEAVLDGLGEGDVVLTKGRGSDKVERITQALLGRDVRCARYPCAIQFLQCGKCPLLGRSGSRLNARTTEEGDEIHVA